MNHKMKIIKHVAYYTMLAVLVSFALSLVYSSLPPVVGMTLQAISMFILGLVLPAVSEKTA